MDQAQEPAPPSFYELLRVHPAAPLDLITTVYWKLTGLLQKTRDHDKGTEVALYHLTRAYQTLADHRARAAYDQALGMSPPPLPTIPVRRRSSWMSSLLSSRRGDEPEPDAILDYYEVMRLDPRAHPFLVGEAYSTMRNYYLRLVEQREAPLLLIDLLEEANAVLSNPIQRSEYDALRRKKQPAGRANGDSSGPGQLGDSTRRGRRARESESAGTAPAVDQPAARSQRARQRKPQALQPAAATIEVEQSAAPVTMSAPAPTRPVPQAVAEQSPDSSDNGAAPDDAQGGRLLKTLASASAQLVKGGIGSVHLAQAASKTLREVVEGPPATGAALAYEEEEALLGRLFVNAANPDLNRTDDTEEQVLARLTVVEGPATNSSYEVRKMPAVLGEDDACDIKLPGLASQQARLLHYSGQFVLHSLADEPATCVGGAPVSWALLRDGDSLELGPYKLSFNLSQ